MVINFFLAIKYVWSSHFHIHLPMKLSNNMSICRHLSDFRVVKRARSLYLKFVPCLFCSAIEMLPHFYFLGCVIHEYIKRRLHVCEIKEGLLYLKTPRLLE